MQERDARHGNAVARPQKIRLREHKRGREPAGTDEFLRTVTVGENLVQQRRALNQPFFQRAPFVWPMMNGIGSSCHGRSMPRGRRRRCSNALFVDEPLAGFVAALEFRRAEFVEGLRQPRVMSARYAVLRQRFVERRRVPLVIRQQTGGRERCLFGIVGCLPFAD